MPSIPSGKICILGAGGPVGVHVYNRLKREYTLRLTDIQPIEAILQRPARGDWPHWSTAPSDPHEWVLCDVTNPDDVSRAVAGCDAIINLTVNRSEPVLAFAVNLYGAYNIFRAAVQNGIRRVVHSGPWTRINGYESDYRYDYRLTSSLPYHSGTGLYPVTKGLSLRLADAFTDHHDLEVLTLLISRIRPPDDTDGRDDDVMISFSVSWNDLAEAFACALKAPSCPNRHETFFTTAPIPFEKYDMAKEKRLLGWDPKDRFESFYTRP